MGTDNKYTSARIDFAGQAPGKLHYSFGQLRRRPFGNYGSFAIEITQCESRGLALRIQKHDVRQR